MNVPKVAAPRTLHLTTPHTAGPEVLHLQQLLAKRGWYHGSLDGDFGQLTAQGVRRAKYWLGFLRPDEIAGPRLIGYLEGTRKPTAAMVKLAHARKHHKPPAKTKGQALVAYALTQVGIKESPAGSNMQKYGAWYGANGLPWCAMFQSYCADKVGLKFHYAYVPYVVADARTSRNGLTLVHASNVFEGCFVCYDWQGDGVADHIGVFHHWVNKERGIFATVEGNTSPDAGGDQSNGGEVCHLTTRPVSLVLAFVELQGMR